MFIIKQVKYIFSVFFLDNYIFVSSQNINKCRLFWKTMSTDEHTIRNADESIRGLFPNNHLSSNNLNENIHRRWSADNLSDIQTCFCYWCSAKICSNLNKNWSSFSSTQQRGYTWNQDHSRHGNGHLSESWLDYIRNCSVLYGRGPPPPPPQVFVYSNLSFNNMQKRYYHCHDGEETVMNSYRVNPMVLRVLSKRYWEDVTKVKCSKMGIEFTVMSYNVLAQNLITDHSYLYKDHNSKALDWNVRSKNLFKEISNMRPDIMCLQEVQESHLGSFYSKLESLGYNGIYKKRTGIRCDGCALYYKADKIRLVEYETVEFYQPNISILNRDNIAIVAKFAPCNNPESKFIVATTHLLYNPKRQDVRLAQTQLLLTEIERMSFYHKPGGKAAYWPIIITGDFNSSPDSAVYEFISKGILKYDHLSARKLDNSKSQCQGSILVPRELEITDTCQHAGLVSKRQIREYLSRTEETAVIKLHHSDKSIAKITTGVGQNSDLFSSGTLSHLFTFQSVYNHGTLENPEGTTFQDKWVTVDYIFYSGKKMDDGIADSELKLLSRYRLPLQKELGSMKIPNSILGSDHLCLVAKFKLKF